MIYTFRWLKTHIPATNLGPTSKRCWLAVIFNAQEPMWIEPRVGALLAIPGEALTEFGSVYAPQEKPSSA